MSYFPSFLNPIAALGAATIVIPSLLVLYFLKLRRKEMAVSTTLLWKKAIQDLQVNAPFQKLRRNLLLILQMIALVAMLLAFSRPVTNYTPGAGPTSVILIDRSASMNARDIATKSRLDDAKAQAKKLVDSMGKNATASVIAFADSAEVMQPFTEDTAALRRAIDSITPSDRPTRIKLAYQLAEAQLAFIPEQNRMNKQVDAWVYSDGRVADSAEVAIKANLKFVKIGTNDAKNIAVVAMQAKRNYERPTEVQVFARLTNFGPEPVRDVQVTLNIAPIDDAGKPTGEQVVPVIAAVTLPPDRWSAKQRDEAEKNTGLIAKDSVEFKIDLTTAALVTCEQMEKEGDQLPADDVARVFIPPPKTLAVLVVTDGNYFLEKALASLNIQKPDQMTTASYDANVPTTYDVIIFDRHSPKKLPPNGNFIYFGGLADGLKLKLEKDAAGNVQTIDDVGVLDWKRDQPILKALSLTKLYVGTMQKLVMTPEDETLIDGVQGPLLVLHREGRSTHLVATFDLMQSNWPLRVSFPIFLYNALQYMAVGSELDVRQSYSPGDTPRLPRTSLQKVDTNLKAVTLTGPGVSTKLTVPDSSDFALPSLERVGVYALDPIIPGFEKLVVNLLNSDESNLLPLDTPPGSAGETIAADAKKSRLDLWWWIVACGVVPMLFIEWWVYTRRVHM